MRFRYAIWATVSILPLLSSGIRRLDAQSLRGSASSVERMYQAAVNDSLKFYETPAAIQAAVAEGVFVKLVPSSDFSLHDVSQPYARPATVSFVKDLASQFYATCKEPMVVTGAARPEEKQPRNASELSVHPAGIAVDLRKPSGRCLTWLRKTLLSLEQQGVIEATEERKPAHFHVAVFAGPYTAFVEQKAATPVPAMTLASTQTAAPAPQQGVRYTVRPGDSLWSIAQHYDTSVDALREMNTLRTSTIRAGQTLVLPGGR